MVFHAPPCMKISRTGYRWRVMETDHVIHDCLEALALEQGYRVCAVSRALGLTERHFQRIFLRDVGLTPKEWMRRERMVVARRLLAWGINPLLVGERLGFNHANSFRREFGMVYGVSPWRFPEIRVAE